MMTSSNHQHQEGSTEHMTEQSDSTGQSYEDFADYADHDNQDRTQTSQTRSFRRCTCRRSRDQPGTWRPG